MLRGRTVKVVTIDEFRRTTAEIMQRAARNDPTIVVDEKGKQLMVIGTTGRRYLDDDGLSEDPDAGAGLQPGALDDSDWLR